MSELHCEEEEDVLCLSRRALRSIPASVLHTTHLKSLYLEGNEISSLPERFFSRMSSLVWLDVRNNRLSGLPAAIGQHRCLKTLLLEGNPISALPPELGHVITLKALSLRKCPLVFPPQDVLDRGLPSILHYLRSSALTDESAAVEKLCLSELEQCEEDETEILRFEELRRRMIQVERAELGSAGDGGTGTPRADLISSCFIRLNIVSALDDVQRSPAV
ncbi:leucine-rich repeat-containing protein 27 isoform X2 [Carassius auratus]|uniref:Leucine-rich repeat-containing protein 27 isoform X2 n=1 Tax=Carassius auratus TaxID=7957 RepID=A0A6P6LAD1_CARAU|nr:leucine-rich repeat-containing protein 27 isoform X2 [Carassius auratus]